LVYCFDKPRPDGSWQNTLTPLELLDRLARFILPPRRHLHRYHGVFAPHANLRAQVAERSPLRDHECEACASLPYRHQTPAAHVDDI
jgi:hypothetical protein